MLKLPKFKFLLFFAFMLCMIPSSSYAAHIVGGEVTYECLGNGNYRFTLQIYRDCFSEGALFDSASGSQTDGTVSIYNGTALLRNVTLGAPIIENIPENIDNPCLVVPEDVCVERGTYTFTENLPPSELNYTITYQRCCRNGTINNILDPGDTGATYTIDLTPTAQTTCNNSPVFNNFPEIIICANEPLVFDHSATDAEGDFLEYSLCSPFEGGGTLGTGSNGGSPNDPLGVAPNPDAPPPYTSVDFVAPAFTSSFPLGGAPRVTIDPVTGEMTGTPLILGQFVVGVCVKEFRNGELLSTVRRDFQFNVEDCTPTVQAVIREDFSIGNQDFLVNLCGQREFTFPNESFDESNIDNFFWVFDFDVADTLRDWTPTVEFPDVGTYEGILVLNPGETCSDTANIFVNVFPETGADFTVDFDTCNFGPVDFFDQSFTFAEEIVSYDWDFGDGNSSEEQNPSHQYQTPGIKNVVLTVEDNNGCEEQFEFDFLWAPIPAEIIVQPSSFISCTPGGEVTFTNLSFPIDETYDITWNFGDGSTSDQISPTYEFTDPGTFNVSVTIVSPFGCEISRTFNNWITIKQGPNADFSFSPDIVTNFSSQVSFFDQSTPDVIRWQWDFSGAGASRDQNPIFVFRDTGLQEIVLITTAENGCADTAFVVLDVIPVNSYNLPNAFTPNNDDTNDVYMGVGILENISEFDMKIWDRWGELIYETDSQFDSWNGRKYNSGPLLPAGVYVVLVNYETARDGDIQIKAYATLIR